MKLSIIVPVYNMSDYVVQCLVSLVNQTLDDHIYEIIVIDDGSTDDSLDKINQFNHYPQIKIIQQPNGGLANARNTGIKHAQGEWLTFMDSDDYVSDDFYQQLLKLDDGRVDLICANITYVYPDGTQKIVNNHQLIQDNQVRAIEAIDLIATFPMAQNKLYRRTLLIQHQLNFIECLNYEDVDFYFCLFPYLKTAIFSQVTGFYYRQRAGSIMSTVTDKVMDIEKIMAHIYQYYQENNLLSRYYTQLEYAFARHLLGASVNRLLQHSQWSWIKPHIQSHFKMHYHYFPNWKKNPYLKNKKLYRTTIQYYYFELVNKYNFMILCYILYLK